jgi:hypothetical protein
MAAAPCLLLLLLVPSAGAVGGDDWAGPSYLQLRGIEDSGWGHASDAPLQGQGLMDYLKFTHGCGRFAALLATTANAWETFREHAVAGGITIFCPRDNALAAFQPTFSKLSAEDQLAVVLYHGAAARYGREHLALFEWVALRTLAVDTATNKSLALAVHDDGDTVWLWPSPWSGGSDGAARVTKDVSSGDSHLAVAVYVVDNVLLPDHLRRRLDGGDEAAACGRYLGWLYYTVPIWAAMCMAGAGMLGVLTGFFVGAVLMN